MISDATSPESAPKVVLYICADRGRQMPSLAAERALAEGRAFAERHELTITVVVTDRYGEPDPARRPGWLKVRALAAAGGVEAVLVRWPAAIAPDVVREYQDRETRWLQDHGVRVRYTWAPLAKVTTR
ncbi:hypothetical protein M3398_30270 [Streptomyces albidoflavus]|jgi:hypothetical protein|uniref:hypothetical protein n=1 Tax=Streptomyces albidoflavus TaxID=1886 RepID=UPI0020C0A6A0|nr:hypothetical protein [Streptomyces albidoflavus]MCL6281550.1 hypothetical protein [Streptomyces albidoflavus]WTC39910.1 hypothetical protein OH723_31545 [Streptomyces albidoflavus]WTC46028.1 hypothetical protein OH810_31130 [Streptomyces albidoflavus]WTD45934.1 hypothetical protein OH730_30885 [Streptomyces albidoflavus]WTD86176.1 hypothetical protein OHA92_31115 [Streptomyces albidoflavus]